MTGGRGERGQVGRRAAVRSGAGERGQALLLMLAAIAAALVGTLVLVGVGQGLGAKSRHQRAADLAAVSAAHGMRRDYFRLFEPATLPNGLPNPHRLTTAQYLARARTTAVRGGARNGVTVLPWDVAFPGGGFAPTRVRVSVRGEADVRIGGIAERARRQSISVEARATAELAPMPGVGGMPEMATGGGYSGPLAYRSGKPIRTF